MSKCHSNKFYCIGIVSLLWIILVYNFYIHSILISVQEKEQIEMIFVCFILPLNMHVIFVVQGLITITQLVPRLLAPRVRAPPPTLRKDPAQAGHVSPWFWEMSKIFYLLLGLSVVAESRFPVNFNCDISRS